MAFRKIPKKFDMAEIAADLKNVLQYSDCIDSSVIDKIAAKRGCKKRTVYAQLSGEIKIDLEFLHAAVEATNGDPEVRKYLEPTGYILCPCADTISPDKDTQAEECLDDLPKLIDFHQKLLDPDSTYAECDRARDAAKREIDESMAFRFKNKKG